MNYTEPHTDLMLVFGDAALCNGEGGALVNPPGPGYMLNISGQN